MNIVKKLVLGIALTLSSLTISAAESFPTVTVYKSATCGCCDAWVMHLEENGFKVQTRNVENMAPYKKQANVPYGASSCHTAFVGGYAVEGHVPAADIKGMLTEKPAIRGLAVPGMPMGSPGMEYGDSKDPYNTISYTKSGQTSVFASH